MVGQAARCSRLDSPTPPAVGRREISRGTRMSLKKAEPPETQRLGVVVAFNPIEDVRRGRVQVVRASEPGPGLSVVEAGGSAHAVVWPGSGAQQRSMHLITLDPGGRTVDLSHESECVYHVSEGSGTIVDLDADESYEAITGSMFLIEPGTSYQFTAGTEGAVILGGPCPPDPALYAHIGD